MVQNRRSDAIRQDVAPCSETAHCMHPTKNHKSQRRPARACDCGRRSQTKALNLINTGNQLKQHHEPQNPLPSFCRESQARPGLRKNHRSQRRPARACDCRRRSQTKKLNMGKSRLYNLFHHFYPRRKTNRVFDTGIRQH